MTDSTAILAICTVLGLMFLGGLLWFTYRVEAMFREWGKARGFRVLSHEECLRSSSLGQTVYKVTVVDTVGRRRKGTARCETRLLGLLPEEIAVRWDD